jgi:hypothetical protein
VSTPTTRTSIRLMGQSSGPLTHGDSQATGMDVQVAGSGYSSKDETRSQDRGRAMRGVLLVPSHAPATEFSLPACGSSHPARTSSVARPWHRQKWVCAVPA